MGNTMTLQITSDHVNTKQGVPISCIGVAQVKIESRNDDMLRQACAHFLGKTEDAIRNIALETMEGHQRAIMGQMTVEEIVKERKAFGIKVFEVASTDLLNMGIQVVSYTLKDIRDRNGYLKALGSGRSAQVKRDARIGEATAKKNSSIKEAEAEEQRMKSKFENDTLIAEAKRDYDLRQAANDQEVKMQKAISDLARNLQDAKTKQQVKSEEMKIKIIERARQIELQEQEILRREKELQATVMKPAEAEGYKLEKLADAEKQKKVLEAEAEAEQMRKKAEAWKMYQDAAMVDMVLNCLPKVAAEVAAPLTKTKKVTMVSSGGGEIGAAKLTGEVLDVVNRLPSLVESMTGVKLSQALASK